MVGFHGCDRSVAEKVLSGAEEIKVSKNKYDWLGWGAYFWIDNPIRALRWAQETSLRDQKSPPTNRPAIVQPYVIGALIEAGNCLNLMNSEIMDEVVEVYGRYRDLLSKAGEDPPYNTRYVKDVSFERNLDCAVFQYLHYYRQQSNQLDYDTVIGAFFEGGPAYPTAGFHEKTHIQLAVRNPRKSILAYFRPRGL